MVRTRLPIRALSGLALLASTACGSWQIRPPTALPAAAWLADRAPDPWLPDPDAEQPPSPRSPPPRRAVARGDRTPPPRIEPPPANLELRARQRVVAAQRLLGRAGNDDRPFVDEVLHAAGQGVAISRREVYAAALHTRLAADDALVGRSAVRAGDIAFFRDTLDLNGNRRPDDGITLAAIVEQVEDGRVLVIARRAGRVRRLAITAAQPEIVRDEAGTVLNTRLVRWPGESTPRTTGQCLAAFGRPR